MKLKLITWIFISIFIVGLAITLFFVGLKVSTSLEQSMQQRSEYDRSYIN